MTARAVLAAGLVKLNIFNTVTQTYPGFGDSLDADKFEIRPNSEEKTSTSRSHLDYGQARASVVLPQPTEISIDLAAASAASLALQFQGLVQALSQASGTLTEQTVALPAADGIWVSVGKRNLAESGFTVTNEAGTTTYVLGTHYEVNWSRGEIRSIAGASGIPTAGSNVKVSGSYGAVDGKTILGGRVTQVRCQVRFDGQNLVDGTPIEVDVWEAVLGASAGFDFLSSDFVPTSLTGKLVKPASKAQAYEVHLPQATA